MDTIDTKKIAEIPVAIAGIIFVSYAQDVIKLNPFIVFGLWAYMSIYSTMFMLIKLINGGYKNDFYNEDGFGNDWRPGLIAVVLLLLPVFIIVSVFLWGNTKSENYLLMFGIVILSLILSYYSLKFRFKIFELFTPEKKDSSLHFTELRECIKWYHWTILIIYSFVSLPYFLMLLGY